MNQKLGNRLKSTTELKLLPGHGNVEQSLSSVVSITAAFIADILSFYYSFALAEAILATVAFFSDSKRSIADKWFYLVCFPA